MFEAVTSDRSCMCTSTISDIRVVVIYSYT